ncbi:peptidoglycan-binding protein [Patescibacteria group bacterium]|nr:peptidoglycan-binding protein [Patescibacteria group bacterium]
MSNNLKRTKVGKITSVLVSAATVLYLSGAAVLVPIAASAQTIDELQAQIATLLAQITQLQSQLSGLQGGSSGTVCGYTFGADLKTGSTGTDVMNLQKALNSDSATQVASSGVGSSGNETSYFGSLTKAAAIKFQNKYASEVLTPIGLSAGTGYVGSMTRTKLNALYGGACTPTTPTTPGETTTPSVGTGISVSSATQPSASIAVESAARMPFTKVTLTAGTDGDVVVNSIQVERTGLAQDAVFAGVVLLDENGQQLGIEKTFNSDHKTTIGEAFTVKAGQSRTMTIAGNMAATLDSYAGQVAFLSVVGVNTSATVTGALPVTGAGHTINATLTIGSVTVARGSTDPGSSQTKEIGITGYTFSAIKVTAGSAENIRVHSIRWNQSGSAASADLENIKVYADSTAYDATVSSDGKYYTATFGTGIVVNKGNNLEIAIKGDISGGSARTIDFDIYKRTDLYVTGETYGYGITPPNGTSDPTDDTAALSSTNPWYDAAQVTVSNGTINIQKATSGEAAAQNISVNVSNQPLGGFIAEVRGEPISVAQIILTVATTTGGTPGLLTNVSLYDGNGAVVAGPVDATDATVTDGNQTVTFTDTVTFPVGTNTYIVKGKVPSSTGNNMTYAVSFTPSTAMTTVTGQTTGNTITPSPASAITLNTMTVKSSVLAISVSANPVAQTVVAGGTFTFANYYFDATASGEDIKMVSVPLEYNIYNSTATNLTSCQLYDGSTSITAGSNIINPSAAASSTTFTFDGSGLILAKGTTKSIALKCNIGGGSTGAYAWGIDSGATFSGSGVTSGSSLTPTATANMGQKMTLTANGTLTVVLDSSSPSYAIAAANTAGNTLAVLKFHAENEAINLQRVALQLSNTASNSPQDLTQVTLWDGATKVGSLVFTTDDNATSTLTSVVTIPKDGDKIITVKGDLSAIGTSQPGTQGHLVTVDYDGEDPTGTQGVGASSGATINHSSTADTASTGVRAFKSFPTIAKLSAGSTKLVAGNISIYRFKVTADSSGDIGIYKLTARVATSSTTEGTKVDNVNIYAYTDSSFSNPVSGIGDSGEMLQTAVDCDTAWVTSASDLEIYAQTTASASTSVQVPAGSTRYFDVKADVTTAGATYSASTQIQGDAAYLLFTAAWTAIDAFMLSAENADSSGIQGTTNDDFIWSPNATTTTITDVVDWTNGYGVSGLPSGNMTPEILTQ